MEELSRRKGPKRVVLGVSGGIAAYKSAELVRLLTGASLDVVPIMTPWAARFLGPLTLETLTGHEVHIEAPQRSGGGGIAHISLVRGARLLLIAPLTANTLAKMAQGLADNFLTSTYLAHRGPTLVCPAMNTAMLEHPATRRNLNLIGQDGVHICMGEAGDLACGETGAGRMAEPEVIADEVMWLLGNKIPALTGRHVLVSTGPTREDLDPVRFISNRSSGKMGAAVARAFRDAGAEVTLVHGPVEIPLPRRMKTLSVRSAAQMAESVFALQATMDIIVMAAAVADYSSPKASQKLKKSSFDGTLRLERTVDILATLGARKQPGQILAGFAAETEAVLVHARAKLERKNLDFIFANDVSEAGAGFAGADNHLWVLDREEGRRDLGMRSKQALAEEIVQLIAARLRRA